MKDNRSLLIPDSGWILLHDQDLLEVNLGEMNPEVVVAELQLLSQGLVQRIGFRKPQNEPCLRIELGNEDDRGVGETSPNAWNLTLAFQELQHWQAFFLRYYLHGLADVGHLDVEVGHKSDVDQKLHLVIGVSKYTPPVSEQEARRRLGL